MMDAEAVETPPPVADGLSGLKLGVTWRPVARQATVQGKGIDEYRSWLWLVDEETLWHAHALGYAFVATRREPSGKFVVVAKLSRRGVKLLGLP